MGWCPCLLPLRRRRSPLGRHRCGQPGTGGLPRRCTGPPQPKIQSHFRARTSSPSWRGRSTNKRRGTRLHSGFDGPDGCGRVATTATAGAERASHCRADHSGDGFRPDIPANPHDQSLRGAMEIYTVDRAALRSQRDQPPSAVRGRTSSASSLVPTASSSSPSRSPR